MAEYERLRDIYYDPEAGLSGITQLIQRAKEAKIDLTQAEIRKWFNLQVVNQIYTQPAKRFDFHIYAEELGYLVADLVDLSKLHKTNGGHKFIFSVIDVHSRYAWLFPLKNKTPTEIAPHLEKVLNEVEKAREDYDNKDAMHPQRVGGDAKRQALPLNHPISFTTDTGSEFFGAVDRLLKKHHIDHWMGNPNDNTKHRTAHVERLHRTILQKMRKVYSSTGKANWVDYLKRIETNYNTSVHRMIKQKPKDVFMGVAESKEIKRKDTSKKFLVGDKVRVELPTNIFSKNARAQRFSTEIYEVQNKVGNMYLVTSPTATIKRGKRNVSKLMYLPDQLMKVEQADKPAKVEKIQAATREIKKATTDARLNKGRRDYAAVGHDAIVNAEGDIVLKSRLLPTNEKRVRKVPARLL